MDRKMVGSEIAPAGQTPGNTIEVSSFGKWTRVPVIQVLDKSLVVRGKLVKRAVIHNEEWLETEVENPELCLQLLKEHNSPLDADLFTFTQKVPDTRPRYAYHVEYDSVAVARTGSFKEWWEDLPQEARKNVRRSEKRGVKIVLRGFEDQLISDLVALNNDSPMRQGRPYAHYGKTFDQVKKDQRDFEDRSDFICAYFGEELIGFLRLVYRGDVASILQLLPKASHHDKRPANALVAKAVELCELNGAHYLTYGMFNYGNKRESPLREFKERNGFTEMLIPRYYSPLTIWGAISLRLGLHRGLVGIFPPRIIKVAVAARAKWYNVRQLVSRCSSTPERPNSNRQVGCSSPPAGSTN